MKGCNQRSQVLMWGMRLGDMFCVMRGCKFGKGFHHFSAFHKGNVLFPSQSPSSKWPSCLNDTLRCMGRYEFQQQSHETRILYIVFSQKTLRILSHPQVHRTSQALIPVFSFLLRWGDACVFFWILTFYAFGDGSMITCSFLPFTLIAKQR